MDPREKMMGFVRALPVAQRVTIGVAALVLVLAAVPFVSWVASPSYTVLYSNLDDAQVAQVIGELDAAGVPYQLEGGGRTVLVPQAQLYETRANLAAAGVATTTSVPGYELLDGQGLGVSDFKQKVDYQRALEGEIARTLQAMDGVEKATVRLVIPEQQLFTDQRRPSTASVLLATKRPLDPTEVEAVTFLVASSVDGLETTEITVADSRGTVLHAPGEGGGLGGVGNRQLRQTREFEQVLGADIAALLERATGSAASVVVRATLDFDESETQTETYGPENEIVLRERVSAEEYEGAEMQPGGVVGVDGGPVAGAAGGTYSKDDASRDFGVDKTVTRTVRAPGRIDALSVAIVVDDGSQTGAVIPADGDLEALVSAAVGLDPERGDDLAVTRVPYPAAEAVADAGGPMTELVDRVPSILGGIVLLVIAIGLFRLTRRGRSLEIETLGTVRDNAPTAAFEPVPAPSIDPEPVAAVPSPRDEVVALVEQQPEEIAALLRGWLSDRRSA